MMKLINKLFYLADEAPKSDSNLLKHFRGRVHLGMLIMLNACLIPLTVYISLSYIFSDKPLEAQPVLVILIVIISLYSAAALAIVYTGMTDAVGLFTTAWSALILFSVMAINSGVPESDALPLIVIPIGMGFCFLGYRTGIAVGILCIVFLLTMASLKAKGMSFPDLIHTEIELTIRSYIWLMSFVSLIGTLTCYEWIISRLAHSRGNINKTHPTKALQADAFSHALVNKDTLSNLLESAVERAQNHNTKLLMIHIHVEGEHREELLNKSYTSCHQLIRKIDHIVRLEDSCFYIILENIRNQENAFLFTQTVRNRLQKIRDINWHIDTELFPDQAKSFDSLLRQCAPFGQKQRSNHV